MPSILSCVLIGFFVTGFNHLVLAQRDYNIQYMEASIGFAGSQQNFSFSYQFVTADNASNRRDKPLMMQIGLGVRFTSYLATKEFYSSVPEMIMFPGALTYKPDPDPTKKDSVFIPGPQLQCLNLFFNINFELKNWLRAGMNGDIIGYTFGPQRQGLYINGTQAERVTVTPEHFNCFWIEKGDESGMLLVEFFVTIPVADHIELKLAAQVLDMVYLTDRPVQTYPRANDRFRLQSYMWSAGIAYGIGKKSKR